MSQHRDEISYVILLSKLAAILTIAVALPVVLGWAFGRDFIIDFLTSRMKPNAALCLFTAAVSLLLLNLRTFKWQQQVSLVLAGVAFTIALVTFTEYLAGTNFGIDELWATDRPQLESQLYPGRMSPITALFALMVSMSLVLRSLENRRPRVISNFLAGLVAVCAPITILGYVFEVKIFYQIGKFIRISPYTASLLFLLSIGILVLRRKLTAKVIFSKTPGYIVLRRLVLPIVVLPTLLSWLSLRGAQAGLYSSETSIALIVAAISIFFGIFVIFSCRKLELLNDQRLLVHEQLKISLAEMQSIFASMPIGLAFLDMQRRFVSINEQLSEINGKSVSQHIGRKIDQVIPKSAEILNQLFDVVIETGKAITSHSITDGKHHWNCSYYPIKTSVGLLIGLGLAYTDVTTAKHTELELVQSKALLEQERARLKAIIDHLPVGLVIAEAPSGKIVLANDQVVTIFRQPETWAENISQYVNWNFFHLNEKPFTLKDYPLTRALQQLESATNEEVFIEYAEGDRTYLAVNFTPILTEHNRVVAAVCIFHDMTEKKRIEQELVRAKESAEQANKAKSVFIAHVSHEIRNPLAAIKGYSELLIRESLNSDQALSWLQTIVKNAEHLHILIDDILDLSKIEAGHLSIEIMPCSIEEILNEVRSIVSTKAENKGIDLRIDINENVPKNMATDRNRMRQILLNILDNAIKFTERGTVSVFVDAPLQNPTDEFRQVRFFIKDTGIGLSVEQQQRLFMPFAQADSSISRRFGGTGLGLQVSRQLAQALGGDLELMESSPGMGSTFLISVKCVPISDSIEGNGTSHFGTNTLTLDSIQLAGVKVLLVDDAADNRILASKFLELAGAHVTSAENGFEALKKLIDEDFSVVLMDLQMPVMSGEEAAARLRSSGYAKPIVALTGFALKEQQEKCLALGFDAYLTKPINQAKLVACVANYANQAAATPTDSKIEKLDSIKSQHSHVNGHLRMALP